MRAFPVMMDVLDHLDSVDLFLLLFSVIRPSPKSPRKDVGGWVSLLGSFEVCLFSPYSASVKGFKVKYFYVIPKNRAAKERVGTYGENGKVKSFKFPFPWSNVHYAEVQRWYC